MVPDDSDRIPRAPPYSGVSMTRCPLPVREYHPLRRDFPDASGSCIRYFLEILQPRRVRKLHGLGSSRFDRHYSGNRSFFLLLRVLRCFSSLRLLRQNRRRRVFNPPGCPIRISPDQFLFADPRSFSQLTTSFFASGSQGILRSLLFSFSYL